jgi:hypothetical protein
MKFMAITNYTYLKLKMLGPHGVITIGTSFHCVYECDLECCKLAAVTITSEELTATRVVTVEEASDASGRCAPLSPRRIPRRSSSTLQAPTARCYASARTFLPNRKAHSLTSFA